MPEISEKPSEARPEDDTGTDPKEQAQRSALMRAAGGSMYSDKGLEKTVSMMQGDVLKGAAQSVALLMNTMVKDLQARGKQISEDVLIDVGQEILERTLAIGAEAGLIEFKSQEEYEQAMHQAGEMALSLYEQMQQGQQGQQASQPAGQPMQQPARQPLAAGQPMQTEGM